MPQDQPALRQPIITNAIPDFELPEHYAEVLKNLFEAGIVLLIILEKKFDRGRSGAIVLQVSLFTDGARKPLPAVVKLGPGSLIKQEWNAFRDYIEGCLPFMIPIKGKYLSKGEEWGGLSFELAGHNILDTEAFLDYCKRKEKTAGDIVATMDMYLFPALKELHLLRCNVHLFMQASYGNILPVQLVVKPDASTQSPIDQEDGEKLIKLTPNSLSKKLENNHRILLKEFVVTEIATHEEQDKPPTFSVIVNTPFTSPVQPSFRIRIEPVPNIQLYEIGKEMPATTGQITQTQVGILTEEAFKAFEETVDFSAKSAEKIRFDDKTLLPNPLPHVSRILDKSRKDKPAWVGTILGDLNVQNLLVFPDNGMLMFIDFAAARKDHILHDFLRLERGIVTELLTLYLSKPAQLHQFYLNLHEVCANGIVPTATFWIQPELEKPFRILEAIRKASQGYFADQGDWTEYYEGLVLYLLGSLKYIEWDNARLSKQLAVIGAASLLNLMENKKESQTPFRIPERLFSEMKEIVRSGEWQKFDTVTVVVVRPGKPATIKVHSAAGWRFNDVKIESDAAGQITLTSWDLKAKPIKLQDRWLENPWPHKNHEWISHRIRLKDKLQGKDGRMYSFEDYDSTILSVWQLTHTVRVTDDRTTEDKFLVLVVREKNN